MAVPSAQQRLFEFPSSAQVIVDRFRCIALDSRAAGRTYQVPSHSRAVRRPIHELLIALVALVLWGCAIPALAQAQAQSDTQTTNSNTGPIRLRSQEANTKNDGFGESATDEFATGEPNPDDAQATETKGARPRAERQPTPTTGRKPIDPLRPWTQPKPAEFESFAKLPRYGHDMIAGLAAGATDFNPIIPPDYVVRTGDEVQVTIWGSVDADLRLEVDKSGRIRIPRVGPVLVAGTRLADLGPLLTRRASLVFRNFELTVGLGRLRGVRVYVTGFVQRPGAYVVSSLSTAMNAVMRAGGPADSGSYRSIELRRSGQVASRLDLYDLLVRGDRKQDLMLQPDDVIHVNAVGAQVAVRGSVNRQAIYELRAGETLGDTLRMAGGFSAVADRGRVTLQRLEDRHAQRIVELKLPANDSAALVDGDIVTAISAVDATASIQRQNKRVVIEGEVARPGEYLLPPEASLRDALRVAGGLMPSAYVYGTVFTRESVRQAQQQNYDRALRDFETQIVRSSGTQRVTTAEEAAVIAATSTANARLLDQLRALKPSGRVVLQLSPGATDLPDMMLESGDRLTVPARPNSVGVFGSVFSAGSFLYSQNRTIGDYLGLAGGPTRGADQPSVFVVRANGTVASSLQSEGLFARGLQIGGLAAEPGDTIFVPEELNKTTWVQATKDWTQILYQFGLGVAGIKSALGW